MRYAKSLCIDDPNGAHAWHGTGLDIVGDPERCVYTTVCVWCGKTAARAKPTDPPFLNSVRIRA